MYHPISHAQRKTTPNFLPTLRNLRSGCDRSERTRLWAWLDFSRHGENPWKCPIQRAWPRTTTSRIHLGSPSLNAEVHKHQLFQRKETHDKLVKKLRGFRYQRGFDLLIHLAQVDVAPLSRWRGGKSRHTSMNSWRLWNHSRFEMCKGHNNLCELQLHIMTYYDCILFPNVQHMNNSFLLRMILTVMFTSQPSF